MPPSAGCQKPAHSFLKEVFKTDLFLTTQQQLSPLLRKLKMPPFVINYTPVGHNCDFSCLIDHWRKQSPSSRTSLFLFETFPTRAERAQHFPAGLQRSHLHSSFMLLLQLWVVSLLCCGLMASQFQSCACQTGRHPGLPPGGGGRGISERCIRSFSCSPLSL